MIKNAGLYIHIPFCVKKCAYCDFPSYSGMEYVFEQYIDALLLEAQKYKEAEIETVFIGGGTPTCLSAENLERLLIGINNTFKISPSAEFSAEANPGTIDSKKLWVLKNYGVNRLSIGVQSFDDDELKMLGRIHDSKAAIKTVELAKKYFDNINIDIMTAIPRQNKESLMRTVKTAVNLGTNHLSCYSLIIEEGTEFYDLFSEGKLDLCTEDEDREMYEALCAYLKGSGFERYEISNFAKPGSRCRHNFKYWKTEDYIGIGAAAHSCINGKRFNNSANIHKYIASPGTPEEVTELTEEDLIGEYVMMALRTSDGVNFNEFYSRFGKNFSQVFRKQIDKFKDTGFVNITENGFALTEKGFDVSNSIMCEFL